MRRRPSAGEQTDPGVGLEEGCVQKDPSCKAVVYWGGLLYASLPTQCLTVGRVRPGWEYLQNGNLSFNFLSKTCLLTFTITPLQGE